MWEIIGNLISLKDRLTRYHKVHTGEKHFCAANVESILVEDIASSGPRKFTGEKTLSSRQTPYFLSHVEAWRLCALWGRFRIELWFASVKG